MALRCILGFHKWEVVRKELIKSTGVDFAFWTRGVQKAEKECRICRKVKKVYRYGWVGSGGTCERWHSLTEEQEKYIDSLPLL